MNRRGSHGWVLGWEDAGFVIAVTAIAGRAVCERNLPGLAQGTPLRLACRHATALASKGTSYRDFTTMPGAR